MRIEHPIGNKKILLIKNFQKIISYLILFFLSLILKIKRNKSEIIISTSFFAPWKQDDFFWNFYKKVKSLTLLDRKRLYTLWYLSKSLRDINANILEIGCLQGGAGFVMSKANKKGHTFLFDTFRGFSEKKKSHKKEHFVYKEIRVVKDNIKKFKLINTKVYKCHFPNDLQYSFKKKKLKLCHIDVNTSSSTKKSFDFVKNKLIKGGIIVFDDYGIYSLDNIEKYIDRISKKYKKDFHFIYNFMGQCILIKK